MTDNELREEIDEFFNNPAGMNNTERKTKLVALIKQHADRERIKELITIKQNIPRQSRQGSRAFNAAIHKVGNVIDYRLNQLKESK